MAIQQKINKTGVAYEVKLYLPLPLQAVYNRQRIYKNFINKKDAEKWEREKLREIEAGYVTINEDVYIMNAAEEYIQENTGKWAPGTIITFAGYVKNYYVPHLNHKPMTRLTLMDFKKFATFVDNLDKATKTKHNITTYLRSFLKWAYSNNYLDDVMHVELDNYSQKPETVRDFLTMDELKLVLPHIEIDDVRDIITFMAFTGMRVSEVCGLRFCDVDYNKRIITVSSQIYYEGGTYRLIPPKCGNISSIQINQVVFNILLSQQQKHRSESTDFVFYDYRGMPFRKDGYLKYNFEKAIVQLQDQGLLDPKKNITFHSLRHTYASMLVHLNENIFTVQHLLRHKDFRLTYNTYAHMYPDKKPEIFNKLDSEFSFLYEHKTN